MATLTGKQIANSYKQLLQIGTDNSGIVSTLQDVQDGEGNNAPLQLSNSTVNINGTLALNGVNITADASALNAITNLNGVTGIVAVSAGNVNGRTLTAGTGVSITNANGTEGNPTIALNPSGATSGSYAGANTNFEINTVGQVVSIGAASSISVSGSESWKLFPPGHATAKSCSYKFKYDATNTYNNVVTHSAFQPYVTKVGLYNDFNELLAIGQLSHPIKNEEELALAINVRFDS